MMIHRKKCCPGSRQLHRGGGRKSGCVLPGQQGRILYKLALFTCMKFDGKFAEECEKGKGGAILPIDFTVRHAESFVKSSTS